MVDPADWKFETRAIEGFEGVNSEVVFDYPMRYGGTASDEKPASSQEHDQTMAAFGIQTGQKTAQAKIEESTPI